jgi:hypothetical protein
MTGAGEAQSVATAAGVEIWTLGPDWQSVYGANNDPGKTLLYIWPSCSTTLRGILYYTGSLNQERLEQEEYTVLPYHWEHVLVWGAAAMGAKFLRPELYPLYLSEYEQGLKDMQLMLTYWPDSVPTMRGINGPYANSPRMMAPPRLPLGQ